MKTPRSRSSFFLFCAAATALGAFACGSSDDDTGLTQAIGGSAGATGTANGGSTSKGGSAGSAVGKGGSSSAGCGDLFACCISLSDPDDKSSCQSTAAALADSDDGAAQCQKALAAYQAQGLCEGGSPGKGGTGGKGGGAAGKGGSGGKDATGGKGGAAGEGSAAGKGGAAGEGGVAGKGGAAAKGGAAGTNAAGGVAGAAGGNDVGGAAGTNAGGNDVGGAAGTNAAGAAGEAQGGAGQGGAAQGGAGQGGSAAGQAGASAGTSSGGSSAGQAGAAGGPIAGTVEAACQSWAEALCTKIGSCGGILDAFYLDTADCVARTAKLDCPHRFVSGLSTPWTPAEIAACGNGWNTSSCNDLLLANPAACAGHKGTRALKGNCAKSSDCLSGFCSIDLQVFPDSNTGCGVCRNPSPPEDAFADCLEDSDCGTGLYCEENNGRCVRPRVAGQSCQNVPCAPGYFCTSGASPVCELRRKMGDACTATGQCSERFGLVCINGACGVETKAFGTACPAFGYCVGDGWCEKVNNADTCVAPLPDGAACTDGFLGIGGDNCRYPASCVNGTCSAKYTCGS